MKIGREKSGVVLPAYLTPLVDMLLVLVALMILMMPLANESVIKGMPASKIPHVGR